MIEAQERLVHLYGRMALNESLDYLLLPIPAIVVFKGLMRYFCILEEYCLAH